MRRRVIVVNRKILGIVCLVLVVAIAGITIWQSNDGNSNTSAFSQYDNPEVTITAISTSPKTITKDLTYEGVPFPAMQLLRGKALSAVVSFKNNSENILTNIPVEVSLAANGKEPVTKTETIKQMPPGSVTTLNFGKFPVLGDAKGTDTDAGLHQLDVRVLPNPDGGVTLTTERAIQFIVDSKAK